MHRSIGADPLRHLPTAHKDAVMSCKDQVSGPIVYKPRQCVICNLSVHTCPIMKCIQLPFWQLSSDHIVVKCCLHVKKWFSED